MTHAFFSFVKHVDGNDLLISPFSTFALLELPAKTS